MIDIKKYLQSGKIEAYCLGLSEPGEVDQLMELCENYSEVKEYLENAKKSALIYLKSFEKKTPKNSLDIIQETISENEQWKNASLSEKEKQVEKFINISRFTNIDLVNQLIKDLHAPKDYDNIYIKNLYAKNGKELNLIWAKKIVPLEEHHDVQESFLVLEGCADCYIDEEIFHMEKGDYMLIPRFSKHKVIITSSTPVKAIQSRVMLQ